jgi:branched-chain amino acid transport system substrate-binding protein
MPRLLLWVEVLAIQLACMVPSARGSGAETVRIGFAAPLTGPSAADGKEMENSVRLAIDDANGRQPTLDGHPVTFEIDAQDDEGDPRKATQIAQHFVDRRVAGVVGHFNSSCSIAASATYNAAQTAEVSPSSTNESYTRRGYNTTFRVVGQDAAAGQALGQYLVDKGARRFAIIDDRSDFGQGLADHVQEIVLKHGGTVVEREYVTSKTIDFSAILTTIRQKHVDLIVFGGFDAQAGQLVRRMRSLDLRSTLAGEGFNNAIFINMAQGDGDGTVSIQPGLPLDSMPGKDFPARYQRRFNEALQGFQAPYAYDAASVVIAAVLGAQSADPALVLLAVRALKLDGVTGILSFDEHGDLAASPYTVYRLNDGRWKAVETIGGAP